MFWEEKIDRLKRKFSQEQFHVPFSDWSVIMKKIEATFFVSGKPAYKYTNWSERLKEMPPFRIVSRQNINKVVSKLHPHTRYWVVIVFGDYPTAKQLVLRRSIACPSPNYCLESLHRLRFHLLAVFSFPESDRELWPETRVWNKQ